MTDGVARPAYEGWAIVELMGHRQTAGIVAEVDVGGVRMLRVDTPGPAGDILATQFYGGSAIYCMTPCDEKAARSLLDRQPHNLPPAVRLVLPERALPAPDHYDADFDE